MSQEVTKQLEVILARLEDKSSRVFEPKQKEPTNLRKDGGGSFANPISGSSSSYNYMVVKSPRLVFLKSKFTY